MIIVCKQERTSNNTQEFAVKSPHFDLPESNWHNMFADQKEKRWKERGKHVKVYCFISQYFKWCKDIFRSPIPPYVYVRRKQKFKAKIIKSCYCVTINENFIINSASLKYGIHMLFFKENACLVLSLESLIRKY